MRAVRRLVVIPGISNHQKSWLVEVCLDLITEGFRSEAASIRSGSSSISKCQHSLLASISGGYDIDIIRVLYGSNRMSCQKLFPAFLLTYDVDTITFPLGQDVLFHWEVKLCTTWMGSCCKEFEDILLLIICRLSRSLNIVKVSL